MFYLILSEPAIMFNLRLPVKMVDLYGEQLKELSITPLDLVL
jgi:hypothetical protein